MERPNARRHGWEFVRTAQTYQHRIFNVREDWLRWPDGVERSYAYMEVGPAVLIVPVTPTGDIVLIREFRYLVDDWVWSVPAGGTHDYHGDDLTALARQELQEEIGGTAEHLEWVSCFYPSIGILDQVAHIYLATGVRLGERHLEPGEQIELCPTPIARALEMARNGEIRSAPGALALFLCETKLRALIGHA